MPILSYTTTVAVERTVSQLQRLLVKAGARGIAYTYDDAGVMTGMSFVVRAAYGDQAYSLPANVDQVRAVLLRQRVPKRFSTVDHAARVAWRIVLAWITAQLALIDTETVGLDQIMLPFAHANAQGTTMYELFVEQRSATAAIEAGGRCG